MKIKAIIFDLDDTLLQTKQTKFAAHKYTAKHFYNIDITDELLLKHWGKSYDTFMKSVYGSCDSFENLTRNYESVQHRFQNKAYSDTTETLKQLNIHYRLGILTSAIKSFLEIDMLTAGIPLELFESIQTAEDTTVHKPDPRVFQPTINRMKQHGIHQHDMVYIGDSQYDAQAANQAGIAFIGISGRSLSAESFADMGVPSIRTISELTHILNHKV